MQDSTNDYHVHDDIETVREVLGLSIEEIAAEIGVSPMTINRWKHDDSRISSANREAFYNYAFRKKVFLNRIKAQLMREEFTDDSHEVLFHGAKTVIEGPLSLEKSQPANDFGRGFYCGESLEQSAMFVAGYPESSLYIVDFSREGLASMKFGVDRDWMLMVAYHRNRLAGFSESPVISRLSKQLLGVDYVVAPIADNRMFEIIDSFIDGEITDVQCRHCLSATDLGSQHVFLTDRALRQVRILEHCYLASLEKQHYLSSRQESEGVSESKVKIARKKYRGRGKYIEEILG